MNPLNKATIAFITLLLVFAIANPTHVEAARGGGGKVTVTAAEPAVADQGQELDVYISGDGFDDGSTATFYVTGTSDDTQIVVESTVYEPSTGRLKSHIKVNGAALVTDYDVEVRTAGGRRGKGTTLFKVSSSGGGGQNDPCESATSLDPTIAYLTEYSSVDGVNSADIMVSNETGCKLTLLVEGAWQYRSATGQYDGPDRFIQSAWRLTYSAKANRGYIAWVDHYKTPDIVKGIGFSFDANGEITPDTAMPQELYVPIDRTVDGLDVHLKMNQAGGYEPLLAMTEYSEVDREDVLLSVFNAATSEYQVISQGPCHLTDAGGCWLPDWWEVRWSPNGDALYFALYDSQTQNYYDGVGRSRLVDGVWNPPELVLVLGPDSTNVALHAVSSSGLMVYGEEAPVYHPKNGRLLGTAIVDRLIDLNTDACGSPHPCVSSDGLEVPKGQYGCNRRLIWTRDHRLVFHAECTTNSIEEILYPLTGENGPLSIKNARREFDTSE